MSIFHDQSVLITGGTGSFGRAFARFLLQQDCCKKVIIFSRDEWKQWEMQQSDPIFTHPKIRYFLGDVRDLQRLCRAFNEVSLIVHAAALKQVPAAEYNPSECIKTNINGAMNVIEASIQCGVKKVIALSTDKAVNPVNLYGATKLCADKLFVAANAYVGAKGHPIFSVVRYGNVAGSRGSILPYWLSLLEQGASSLPLTDPEMTRFWITLDQAVVFVSDTFSTMCGGEVFVPKIPSFRLIELAKAVAPHLPYNISGIRPGEKIHELMTSSDDARHTVELSSSYVILPELVLEERVSKYRPWQKSDGTPVPPDFVYASDANLVWLSVAEMRAFIEKTMQKNS